MYRAIITKELREATILFGLAALGLGYALSSLTAVRLFSWQSGYLYYYPFISDRLGYFLNLVVGGLAIALALRQTAWELNQGTFFFLLHRPISWRHLFGCKLLVGTISVLVCSAALILLYAWWASVPTNLGAPFYWGMTIPHWIHWVAMPPVYFGAFLSGIRPGSWYGPRLMPLMSGILGAFLAGVMPWFWLATCSSVLFSALLVAAIFRAIEGRDY